MIAALRGTRCRLSDHPLARAARRTRRAVSTFTLPAISGRVARPALLAVLAVRERLFYFCTACSCANRSSRRRADRADAGCGRMCSSTGSRDAAISSSATTCSWTASAASRFAVAIHAGPDAHHRRPHAASDTAAGSRSASGSRSAAIAESPATCGCSIRRVIRSMPRHGAPARRRRERRAADHGRRQRVDRRARDHPSRGHHRRSRRDLGRRGGDERRAGVRGRRRQSGARRDGDQPPIRGSAAR